MTYREIVEDFILNPRDVRTNPLTKSEGKWFYVYVDNSRVYVSNAKSHNNSCSIKKPRELYSDEAEAMYELFIRRKNGESVSGEAQSITYNQVYWYGIFNELNSKDK